MVNISELVAEIQQLLQVATFNDYAPNGLQVEGRAQIKKIVSGVTACKALLEAAQHQQADVVLVHHGYFWQNEDPRIIGMKKQRIAFLLAHDMNLLAYHLPLDAHPLLGNNAQLGQKLGVQNIAYTGKANLVAYGDLVNAMLTSQLAEHIHNVLGRLPVVLGPQQKLIKKIAWCTGAAQGYIQMAVDLGVDAFISGEVSEQTMHIADENDLVFFGAGHHATERFGVQALGHYLAEKFGLEHVFIDIKNPI